MKWISLCSLLLSASFLGCSLFSNDGAPTLPIQTDDTLFEVTIIEDSRFGTLVEFNIGFTYTNPTREDRYLVGCNRPPLPDVEKQVDGQWVSAFRPTMDLCFGPVIRMEPGQSLHDSLYVLFISLRQFEPVFREEISGTYRLVGVVHQDPEGEELALVSERVSNAFRLEKRATQ